MEKLIKLKELHAKHIKSGLDGIRRVGKLDEFREFLKEYKIVGLAIAFVMGAAATDLVKSLVNNIIMPIITPLIPNGGWQTAVLKIGPISLAWGPFLSSAINFLILAWVVFMVAKFVLKEEKVTKK